jgi:ribosome-binding protein aMBF1 (putative translation factor)
VAIYPDPPAPFDCAICGKEQMRGRWDRYDGAEMNIPPLCRRCEIQWGKAVGGWGDRNRDRRIIRQVSALAEVLLVTAHCKANGHRGPYERT